MVTGSSLLKVVLFLIVVYLAYFVSYFGSERLFFDKLFYQKSNLYGYTFEKRKSLVMNLTDIFLRRKNAKSLSHRLEDIDKLVALVNEGEKTSVLGKKTNEVYKIAVIGDSYVYGLGVKEKERFTEVLERRLNKFYPTKVFSLGKNGDSILDNYAKYVLAKENLDPDLFVFLLVDNDLMFDGFSKYPGEEEIYNELRIECNKPIFPDRYYSGHAPFKMYARSFSSKYANICILKKIIKQIDLRKERVLFFTFLPDTLVNRQDHSIPNPNPREIVSYYAREVEKNGGKVLSPSDNTDFKYVRVSEKEMHASLTTHVLYAESLYKEILNNLEYNFPKKID